MPAAGASTPKLYFGAGPMAGEQVVLNGTEVVVGRAADVAVSVPDTSVSRRHVSLRRGDSSWLVKDLGSGNGTLLNGEPITEEMPLEHGDVVTLGETEFTFSDDANVTGKLAVAPARGAPATDAAARRPPPTRRPSSRQRAVEDPAARKKKRRTLIAFTLCMLVLVAAAAAFRVRQMKVEALETNEQLARAAAHSQLEAQMQEARNLIRQSQWKEAKAVLTAIESTSPGFQNVGDLLARAEVEIPNQEHLATAQEALKKGEIANAHKAFVAVSADTAMFESAAQVKRALEDGAHRRLMEANELLRQAKYAEALAISEDVLAAYPEHRDAQVMIEQAKEGIAQGKVTPRVYAAPVDRKKPTQPAVDKFMDGDLTGAAALLNACSDNRACKAMLKDVTEFGQLYKKLDNLDERGLSRLLALDRKISDGPQSKLARTAGTKAAGIYLRAAQSYKASGRWDRVGQYLAKALQANPGLVEAKKLQNELRDRAQQTYMSAYSLKDTDSETAIEKFREVLQMTSADDEWHVKSKNWLSKLGR